MFGTTEFEWQSTGTVRMENYEQTINAFINDHAMSCGHG